MTEANAADDLCLQASAAVDRELVFFNSTSQEQDAFGERAMYDAG
jgi:hypothetical protein